MNDVGSQCFPLLLCFGSTEIFWSVFVHVFGVFAIWSEAILGKSEKGISTSLSSSFSRYFIHSLSLSPHFLSLTRNSTKTFPIRPKTWMVFGRIFFFFLHWILIMFFAIGATGGAFTSLFEVNFRLRSFIFKWESLIESIEITLIHTHTHS